MEWNIATLNLAAGAYAAHGVEWAASFDGGYVLHCDRLGFGWQGTRVGGGLPNGDNVFVAID